MKKNSLRIVILSMLAIAASMALTACGGNSAGSPKNPQETLSGRIDSPTVERNHIWRADGVIDHYSNFFTLGSLQSSNNNLNGNNNNYTVVPTKAVATICSTIGETFKSVSYDNNSGWNDEYAHVICQPKALASASKTS